MAGRSFTLPATLQEMQSGNVPNDIESLWDPDKRAADGASSRVAGGASDGGVPLQRFMAVFPPEVVPPRGSTQFQRLVTATTNAVGQVSQLWTFQVPRGSILIVNSLDIYANTVGPATNLVFGVFVNGGAFGDYGVIPLFPSPAASVSRSFNGLAWRFGANTIVTCQVTNFDGGNYLVGAGAQGWYYSTVIDDKFSAGTGV